ncbi:uncharacterized protein LOC116846694 [Odontomachus brunneus]|uniref:uncharacterized protein LOC116846694 n=1 Tax=Odontomachus brunneus TaxID=486640 RepID=UPI0013F1CDB8|nr:uncharacterized protein LOC116846694 [Odontomachus brunneus]XP_032676770.1 uncharacterized protein LOC116846694 [Odontomachus brunneus]
MYRSVNVCITCISRDSVLFTAANDNGQFCSDFRRVNVVSIMASYPKRTKSESERTARPRKRTFHGNQYLFDTEDGQDSNTSASNRKLADRSIEDVILSPLHFYRIIEFLTVFGALSDILCCKSCKQKVTFEESGHRGLGFNIVVTCACGHREIQSGPFIKNSYEVNRRIVFVMRLLGIGHEGLNIFCGLMDMCQGLTASAYNNIVQHLHTASATMFQEITKKSVEEERKKNEEKGRNETHLKVSGDGSWKKRGFTSLFGLTTLIGYYTGSAGKMEVDSITEMFVRSEEKHGVKYVNYIGDGDSKTFAGIQKINPYGDDCPVTKNECVGHVEKRMGSQLRNIKKKEKLSGKNRLTEVLIKKLTIFYGLAIRRNVNSVTDMRKAIFATLDHYCSSDESPRHDNCPPGADSWCKWRQAEARNELSTYQHEARVIDNKIEKHIRPIYEKLSTEDLLTRCLGGHTQNSNESFNTTMWRLNPKHLHSGKKIVELSAYIAAGMFNEGYSSVLMIMQLLGLKIGQQCKMFADNVDNRRIARQDKRHSLNSKEARTARRMEKMHANELYEEEEGLMYGAGIAD